MKRDIAPEKLPNRFDHADAQARIYRNWEEHGYFHAEPDESKQPFTIVIPPPNVTGALHLGHALNNTLQDVVVRFRRMQGYNTLWMPGTDHAGIATQAVVERRLRENENLTRHDLGREQLVERIWQWKEEYETRILGQLKRMGASCDWQRTRFTLDPMCAKAVQRTFADLFQKEWIYRGKRLVNWDTFLQTAVSDDEVNHVAVKGHFWHFRYGVIDPQPGEPTHVTIATTRPETMLGDTAVAVHPDPEAALVKLTADLQERLAKAPAKEREALEKQLENIASRRESMLPELIQLRDMAVAGRQIMLPLLDRPIPLVTDDWAKPELGSGCVKITPAHDPNDYEVGLRQKLPMINIMHADGTLNANAGKYEGLTMKAARKQVVADLEALELLGEVEDREIELAHSDRSKTPIEPYLADQWFVKMDELAQSALDAVSDGRVEIIPPRYAKGYHDWLAEKRDWPVSRQLWWGHRIPIWSKTCESGSQLEELVAALEADPEVQAGKVTFQVETAAERAASEPGDTKLDLPHATIHLCMDETEEHLTTKYEAQGFIHEDDVLDTWFSSALWPHSTLGWPEQTPELQYYYPTSELITSRDIITLWVARMVLMGLNNMGEVPFRRVYIHPKILDGYGETMSKSKGNGVDPLDVIDKFGADALRYGLAHLTTETQDTRLPVQFECPHCEALIDQTKKIRELPRVECPKCNEEFSTQWARSEEDLALPRGAVVSERFELGRNFTNKLWNASRFALLNLAGYRADNIQAQELAVEDRWILSRLATVTKEVTEALEQFRYADAARSLYDFAWEDFCSFYVEMIKGRLLTETTPSCPQRVLAHTLDTLLRLMHPIMPFITEEIWQLLGAAAPERGLVPQEASESIMVAPWPTITEEHRDEEIEEQFKLFQTVLTAVREIRSRQNIAPKEQVTFYIRCEEKSVDHLRPLAESFDSLANSRLKAMGPKVTPPQTHANTTLPGLDIYVDLEGFIDVAAEIDRLVKQIEKTDGMIGAKEKKLQNSSFVDRAPAEIVQRERNSLVELQGQVASMHDALETLRASQ